MAQNIVTMNLGEKRPIYGVVTATPNTTLVISASPAPTYNLTNPAGSLVGGSPFAVTGYDAGEVPKARAWVNLDTTGFSLGVYKLAFIITVTGLDSMVRVFKPTVYIRVVPENTLIS